MHLILGLIYFRTERWTNILEKVFPDLVGLDIKYRFLGDSKKERKKEWKEGIKKGTKKQKMDVTILFICDLLRWRFAKHIYLSCYRCCIGN